VTSWTSRKGNAGPAGLNDSWGKGEAYGDWEVIERAEGVKGKRKEGHGANSKGLIRYPGSRGEKKITADGNQIEKERKNFRKKGGVNKSKNSIGTN